MRHLLQRVITTLDTHLPRLSGWLLVAVALLVGIAVLHPQQMGVVLYKAALVTLAAVLGYWIDRRLFPYARPHRFMSHYTQQNADADKRAFSLTTPVVLIQLRRAVIVLACILGLTLGL